jgi:hypothetical protein
MVVNPAAWHALGAVLSRPPRRREMISEYGNCMV